jgi:hypothetical protein
MRTDHLSHPTWIDIKSWVPVIAVWVLVAARWWSLAVEWLGVETDGRPPEIPISAGSRHREGVVRHHTEKDQTDDRQNKSPAYSHALD